MKRKETYLSRDFRETVALRFPAQAKELNTAFDMGFSAVAIADRVGHESIDITYQYAHLFPSKQIEMAEKLDDLGKGDFENVS